MCNQRRWSCEDFRRFFLEHPLVIHLGRYLPPAVMLILVIYAMRDWRPLSEGTANLSANGWPMILAGLIVAGMQLWRRNALLSILAGTGTYMSLVQWVG